LGQTQAYQEEEAMNVREGVDAHVGDYEYDWDDWDDHERDVMHGIEDEALKECAEGDCEKGEDGYEDRVKDASEDKEREHPSLCLALLEEEYLVLVLSRGNLVLCL
jgi:hypothetical protein